MLVLTANFKEEIVLDIGQGKEIIIRLNRIMDDGRPVLGFVADQSVVIFRRRILKGNNGRDINKSREE